MPSFYSQERMQYTLSESSGNEFRRRGCVMATGVVTPDQVSTVCVSRLGPREREHHDLVVSEACDVDLVAVHEDCRDPIYQTDANLLQDVA